MSEQEAKKVVRMEVKWYKRNGYSKEQAVTQTLRGGVPESYRGLAEQVYDKA